MRATLLQIRLFVAVYEEESFTAAAIREGIGQSGVSLHVRQLEDQLGVSLLNRQRSVIPTPAGHMYYKRCVHLLRAHAKACDSIVFADQPLSGTLRIGLIPAVTRSLLGRAMMAFQAAHPGVSIQVTEAYTGVLMEGVRRGVLDFAICPPLPGDVKGLHSSLFGKSAAFLVSSPVSGLTHGQPVRLRDVKPLNLVLPPGPRFRRLVLERYMDELGIVPTNRLTSIESIPVGMSLIRSSHWMYIAPGLFVAEDLRRPRVTVNPIVDPVLWEEFHLLEAVRTPMSEAGNAFIQIMHEIFEEVNAAPTRMILDEPMPKQRARQGKRGEAAAPTDRSTSVST